jgi:hypothetical protein
MTVDGTAVDGCLAPDGLLRGGSLVEVVLG